MNIITWGHGAQIEGTPFRTVISADETAGQVVVLAVDVPPGLHVDPHTHTDAEQLHVVISGTLTCRVGEERFRIGPGGTVCMPRNVEHELWNETDEFVRVVEMYTPSGMEQRFKESGAAGLGGRPPESASVEH